MTNMTLFIHFSGFDNFTELQYDWSDDDINGIAIRRNYRQCTGESDARISCQQC